MKRTLILAHDMARSRALQAVAEAPDGYVVVISEPRKSRVQEEKYHAMFSDVARQVPVRGELVNAEDMKRLLFSAFKVDTRNDPELSEAWEAFGDLRIAIGFRGETVLMGDQTRKLPKVLASALIEWLYAFGAEHDVRWTEPGTKPRRERIDMDTGEITQEEATA